jgi:hypothetical protein
VRFGYRASQFWHALTTAPAPADLELARQALSPAQMELFLQLQPAEQAHSLQIYRQLYEQKPVDDDLLVAALLHDVGKISYPLRLWERVWIVIARAVLPAKIAKWGQAQPYGWKRPFVIAEQHAAWGADLAARAGTSPTAVSLIRRHQQPLNRSEQAVIVSALHEDQLLQRLQLLDDES